MTYTAASRPEQAVVDADSVAACRHDGAAARGGRTSPQCPELESRLGHGDPRDVPGFPVAWPRPAAAGDAA